MSPSEVRMGAKVLVPWGLSQKLEGKIVEIWGDPPTYVKVWIPPVGEGESRELLLDPGLLERVPRQPKKTSASA